MLKIDLSRWDHDRVRENGFKIQSRVTKAAVESIYCESGDGYQRVLGSEEPQQPESTC